MLKQSLFLDACRGIRRDRPPVWFMRQAGRYLPEYQAIRAKHSMLDTIRTPELAAEVTLQPIRRFGFDAAIIFADILNPLIGMGLDLDFVEKSGPIIRNPVRSASDVDKLIIPDPASNTAYTARAISLVAEELTPRGIPVIAFAGAPLTLSAYALEGGKIGDLRTLKEFMFAEPKAWQRLQEKLVAMIVDYLVQQVDAGASAIQLFDSWLGQLSPYQYQTAVEPYLRSIFDQLRARTSVPLIFFSTGTFGLFPEFSTLPIDVLGVDWRVPLSRAADALSRPLPLQGNLDPITLIAGGAGLDAEVARVLEEGRSLRAHIFNLGHGVLQYTPVENVQRLIDLVKGYRR